jgi:Lar family restriction alleviation protein
MNTLPLPLPCPFCGSAEIVPSYDANSSMRWVDISVVCLECGARGPARDFYNYAAKEERPAIIEAAKQEALAVWNKRVTSPLKTLRERDPLNLS